jgi:hypothetical protein
LISWLTVALENSNKRQNFTAARRRPRYHRLWDTRRKIRTREAD